MPVGPVSPLKLSGGAGATLAVKVTLHPTKSAMSKHTGFDEVTVVTVFALVMDKLADTNLIV